MLSNFTFYQIALATIVTIWCLYFIFSLLYPKLKKFRLPLIIVLIPGAIIVRTLFCNPVYIINDNNEIKETLLVIPHKFLLNNGQYVILKPQPGIHQLWLVNDGSKQAWVESITYGSNNSGPPLIRQQVLPYSARQINNIDYFFQPPPKDIKTINPPVTKGWLHR